jgi:hypothetical protein
MMIPKREREGTPERARRATTTSKTMTLEGTRSGHAQVRWRQWWFRMWNAWDSG